MLDQAIGIIGLTIIFGGVVIHLYFESREAHDESRWSCWTFHNDPVDNFPYYPDELSDGRISRNDIVMGSRGGYYRVIRLNGDGTAKVRSLNTNARNAISTVQTRNLTVLI